MIFLFCRTLVSIYSYIFVRIFLNRDILHVNGNYKYLLFSIMIYIKMYFLRSII